MTLSKAGLVQPQGLTTIERDLLTLAGADVGRLIFNETTRTVQQWDGISWRDLLTSTSNLDATKLNGVVSGTLVDGLPTTKLTGQITDAQVAGVSSTKLIDPVLDAQITSLDAGKLFGVADGGAY
jgi:hypothetical protein